MKYRTLGSTGRDVSVVGVGTWQFGGEWGVDYNDDQVDAIFNAARDVGINLIDTAECYGDHLSEQFVGKAIERDRDQWFVATKFGHKFNARFERDTRYKPEDLQQQLDDSLAALRTDYIDLYQFHSGPDEDFDVPALWEKLATFKKQGKIRHIGISIGGNNVHQTESAPSVDAETIQVIYNRLERAPEAQILPLCQQHNLGVLARVPLASGFLSGKYDVDATFPDTDVRGKWHKPEDRRHKIEQVKTIQAEEVPAGTPMAQWALAWCLKHPAVTCVIPGCKNPDQVRDNAAAADIDMVPDSRA